jgi:PKD repeat protein
MTRNREFFRWMNLARTSPTDPLEADRSRTRRRALRRLGLAAALALVAAPLVFAAPPGADFTITPVDQPGGAPNVADVNETVNFTSSLSDPDTGQTYTYQWDFGDNTTSTDQNPSHIYNSPGEKTVTLVVSDSGGETDPPVTKTLRVNALPNAAVSCSPSTVSPNQATTCSSTGSGDLEGSITYAWDGDGDGQFDPGRTDPTEQFSFPTAGNKTIRLQVRDADNATAEAQDSVTVSNVAPTARFTVEPPNPNVNQTVNFNGSTSSDPEGQPLTFAWDLDGDGLFGTEDDPDEPTTATASRAFPTAGNKTVQLRVTDPENNSDTETKIVTVTGSAPTASFTFSGRNPVTPDVPDVGETINFTSTSTDPDGAGDIARWDWDLDGDGQFNNGSGPTIAHSFTTPGNKTVGLLVTDSSGATNSTTRTVRVNAPPVANMSILNEQLEPGQKRTVPLAGQPIAFTASAVPAIPGSSPAPGCPVGPGSPATPGSSDPAPGSISTYEWDLDGDGSFETNTGNQDRASVLGGFPAGPRIVRLRVTDNDGATATAEFQFRVNTAPTPEFVFQPDAPIIGDQITFGSISDDPDAADAGKLVYSWDLDNDGTFCEPGETGASVTHSFATANTNPGHPVTLRVTDDGGITRPRTKPVIVQNTKPAGSITFSPDAPLPGQPVTFTGSASSPTGKSIASMEWDFSYDQVAGFNVEAAGTSVSHAFPTPGRKTVALRVQEADGGFDIVTTGERVVVNAPPRAGFTVSPGEAFEGDGVTLSSTSADPDGPLMRQDWDLDNDGQFDDANAAVVSANFTRAGTYPLALRVTDSRGATSTATGQVVIRTRPIPPPPPTPLLSGVLIELQGQLRGKFTRVRRLLVRAPAGSKISVRCRGSKRCPKVQTKLSKGSKKKLRFKKLERRFPPKTKLTVSVTKQGFIGKQTRWTTRRRKAPLRQDLCLNPGAKAATACPSG